MPTNSRAIVITGTSRGLGRGLAESFLSRGFTVLGCSRSGASISHRDYLHLSGDLTERGFPEALVSWATREYPSLDSAVLNAGLVSSVLPVLSASMTLVDKILGANLHAPIGLTSILGKYFVRRRTGTLIAISSIAVPMKLKGAAAYSASKAGLETYMQILARELAPFGVTCNMVAPALFDSSATSSFSDVWRRELLKQQDINRTMEIEDIAELIHFLVGSRGRMITGQTIRFGFVG